MDKMKLKKSLRSDGITQECLLLGKLALIVPITRIINSSIAAGTFAAHWKGAIAAPILKKRTSTDNSNYRPVSCLQAASKVLEKMSVTKLGSLWTIINCSMITNMDSDVNNDNSYSNTERLPAQN